MACGQHHTLFLRRDGVVYGCGSNKQGQLPGNPARFSADRTVALPVKMHFPFSGGSSSGGSHLGGGGRALAPSGLSAVTNALSPQPSAGSGAPAGGCSSGGGSAAVAAAARGSTSGGGGGSSGYDLTDSTGSAAAAAAALGSCTVSGSGQSTKPSTGGGSAVAAATIATGRLPPAPVVHLVVAGGNSSVFVTRGTDEIPEVYSINLLAK